MNWSDAKRALQLLAEERIGRHVRADARAEDATASAIEAGLRDAGTDR